MKYRLPLPEAMLAIALTGFLTLAAAADRDPDSNRPIHIEADSLQVNQKQHHAHYSGHVHVTQGSFELRADTLDVYTRDGRLHKLVATGSPARFKKYDHEKQVWTHGEALTITYLIKPQKHLLLQKRARITREKGETLSGERIVYQMQSGTLSAQGTPGKRVHVVLPPEGTTP